MGKIKEETESLNKRHKKHHKKHHHKKDADDDSHHSNQHAAFASLQPSIKLKIKIGGQTVGTQSYTVENDSQEICTDVPMNISHCEEVTSDWNESQFSSKKGDETSDEEREWLDALEAGRLDDNGELKKQRDTSMLTARQKALLHGERIEELQELTNSSCRPSALTEEQLNRRQLRAKRRREQAQEKTEKDKQETLDKLLKKHDSKIKANNKAAVKEKNLNIPSFRYVNSSTAITISVPVGYEHLYMAKSASEPKPVIHCGADGCQNPKQYTCSKTGIPLCSLECYKKNLSNAQLAAVVDNT